MTEKTPKQVMEEVATRAFLCSDFLGYQPKPGEFYRRKVSSADKEILKHLEASDVQDYNRSLFGDQNPRRRPRFYRLGQK